MSDRVYIRLPDGAVQHDHVPRESAIEPNAAYFLTATCPSGFHVGSAHARIEGGRLTLDDPPVYLCGCEAVSDGE